MKRRWEGTLWFRLPAALGRPPVHISLGVLVALLVATPALIVRAKARTLVPVLTQRVLDFVAHDSNFSAILAGLEPSRRASLPARLEERIVDTLPKLALLGFVLAFLAAGAIIFIGRFLRRTMTSAETRPAGNEGSSSLGLGLLGFAAGLAAHVHSLRQSYNTDEASAVLHATQSWWSWADTRSGWQTHMGGELLIRLGTYIYDTDWMARLPGGLLSAAGLGLLAVWIHRRFGLIEALLTIGLICALPVWAEQATLARGYGLLFFSGVLGLTALDRVLEGLPEGGEARCLLILFLAQVLGFLAHFFFFFFSLASLALLTVDAVRRRNRVAAAGAFWLLAGLVPAGLLYLPGLPATLVQTKAAQTPLPRSVVPMRFVEAFGFDLTGTAEWLGFVIVAGLMLLGIRWLAPSLRRRFGVLLLVGVGLPLLLRPVYFYPRFFLHLLPMIVVATLPVASALHRLRMTWRVPAAVAVALAVWALPRPWEHLSMTDIRGACLAAKGLVRPGEPVYIEAFFNAARVYLRDVPVRVAAIGREMPPEARVLISGGPNIDLPPAYPGFHAVALSRGREMDMAAYLPDAPR